MQRVGLQTVTDMQYGKTVPGCELITSLGIP